MSAAFRNFVLTLVIMLAVFGYFAIKALPDIEDAVLGGDESQASEAVSEVVNISVPEHSGTEETSQPDKKEEFDSFSCVMATRNSLGDVCSLVYIGINEENRTYVICRIPVDITVDVDGVSKKFHTLLGDNDNDYIVRKISPLIGKEVKYYIACDSKTYKSLVSFGEKKSTQFTTDLTYPIRYLDPDFAGIIENPPEEYFLTIPAGRVTLDSQNAAVLLDAEQEKGAKNYTFQEAMGLSLFRQVVSLSGVADNVGLLDILRSSVATNVPVAEMLKYASLLFSYNDYTVININYPTMQNYANPDIKTPNWSLGINQINTAEAGK